MGTISQPDFEDLVPINDQSSSSFVDVGNLRIQWGRFALSSDAAVAVTLPASFGDTNYSVTLSPDTTDKGPTTGTVNVPFGVLDYLVTSFSINRDDDLAGTYLMHWQAMGLKP